MKSINQTIALTIFCLLGVASLAAESVESQSLRGSRPNIVFVLTDDQGYGQLGAHGHPWLETPNLDALHARSIAFDDFQVSPTCSPTRSALMTGNHPFKNGVTHTGGGRERLALSLTTLPQRLGEAGYVSGIFGKWHLGDGPGYTPGDRGFDEVFIHGSGGITQPMDAPENTYQDPVVRHNGTFVKTTGFCTDVFFSQALGWIRENKETPFFAYISTNAPHGPFIAPEDKRKKFKGDGFDHNQQGFYGMVENIDENVGRLVVRLREWGLEDNTLVIFMSDNGTVLAGAGEGEIGTREGKSLSAYHAGLKGHKKSPWEGGTRVPAFFSWKGKLKEGAVSAALAAHIDLLPTLVELAGGEVPEGIDGRSLVPLLEDPDARWPDRRLFFHIGRWGNDVGPDGSQYDKRPGKAGFAVRSARYRLVNNEELYDIAKDPGETTNLFLDKPGIVRAMMRDYDAWWEEVRPFMVNDGVHPTGLDAYRKACQKQMAKGPLRAWKATAGVHQANGIKIGEVDENSAIIWTRLTTEAGPNLDGANFVGPGRGKPSMEEQLPPGKTLEDMEGAVPGAPGSVRISWAPADGTRGSSGWKPVDAGRDFTCQMKIDGLAAATAYALTVESRDPDGQPGQTILGSFRTAPAADEEAPVTFVVVTGQDYPRRDHPDGHRIYPHMLALDPDFFIHTGDIEYYDKPNPFATNQALARFKWNRLYGLPRLAEFHCRVASYFIKDDHDTTMNDSWPGLGYGDLTWQQGLDLFREQFPVLHDNYRTIRWGKDLQIWLVEGRDFRSKNTLPDGPEKSIWGRKQKEWFFRTVEESDATFRVLISPTPVIGPDRGAKSDNHANASFAHEGDEIRSFIASQNNAFIICGDRHWQYVSVDGRTGVKEFSCGPTSDRHAGGWSNDNVLPEHRYLNVQGGFLAITVDRQDGTPVLTARHYDVEGEVCNLDANPAE